MSFALIEYNDEGEESSRRVMSEEMVAAVLDRPYFRRQAYRVIDGERDYQDQAWESQDNPGHANNLTIGEFVLLLEEYVLKARAEWTVEPKPETRTLHTVRKIAGIAVNCMEQHGTPERDTFDAKAVTIGSGIATKTIDESAEGTSCS